MKKRISLSAAALLLFLLTVQPAGLADQPLDLLMERAGGTRRVVFTVQDQSYQADLPAGYLEYAPASGQESPLLELTGISAEKLNQAMESSQCALYAVHGTALHQLWISVKDCSGAFSDVGDELPLDVQRAHFDDLVSVRGEYTEYRPQKGTCFFIFADVPATSQGSPSVYVSCFEHKNEITVQWESGNGEKSFADILEIIFTAGSVTKASASEQAAESPEQPEESSEPETESGNGLVVTESNLLCGDKNTYYFAKIENHSSEPLAYGQSKLAVYDQKDQALIEGEVHFNAPQIGPGDYIYIIGYFFKSIDPDQVKRIDFVPEVSKYPSNYDRSPCQIEFELDDYTIHLKVTLDNQADEPMREPTVVYAFYDQDNKLASVGTINLTYITIPAKNSIIVEHYDYQLKTLLENGQTPSSVEAFVFYHEK